MVEYILLVALISLAVIGAVTFLAQQTDSKFQDAGNKVRTAGTTAGAPTCPSGQVLVQTLPDGQILCQRSDGAIFNYGP
jgi:Flp pilus assembly pilin Flp